jgi:hypothetical protein
MAGPSINPTNIAMNVNFIYSSAFGFSGGGTQTILTLNSGEVWIFYSSVINYGGSDFRHGSMFYATRATNGLQIRGSNLGTSQSNSNFNLSGTNAVTYSAGGGNPTNTIYMLRLK